MKYNNIIALSSLIGLSSSQIVPIYITDNNLLLNLVKGGVDEEVVIKAKGAELTWNCKNGNYLDKNEFRKGIRKQEGAIVKFSDECTDGDMVRYNHEFAKNQHKWLREGLKKKS